MAIELTPQGAVPAIGIPNSQDTARLVFSAPYFDTVPIAEIILPSVEEAVQAILPSLVPPYVDQAAQAAVQQSAVLLTGSTMSGPLNLSPLLPVSDSMAATKAYVDTMVSTAGVPEVPAVPVGQSWVRQVGQWAPLATSPGGPFLALSGGAMQGQINMSGNAITNLPAVPVMPNGAAPATWVLNQISAVSLYQGTWNLDTFTPDLTQPSTHINGYTWIAITNAPAGVVISPAVPGLQGMTVFNGDTVIFSAAQGGFSAIHAGGLTAPQADARYLMLVGGQLSGALLLNSNASQPLQAVTLQQLQAFVPPGIVPEAPGDGQLYGRNGLTHAWTAVLPLAGGVMSGALSLSGNASSNLHAVPFQQLNTAIATAVSGYVPITGTTMTGLLVLSGNAGSNLNPVPLQQLNAMLNIYLPRDGSAPMSGTLNISQNGTIPAAPGALLHLIGNNAANTLAAFDSFGTGFYPELRLRAARGTGAAPTAVQSGDLLGLVSMNGRDSGGNYNLAAQMYVVATENWTTTNRGSAIQFNTNILGTPGTTGNPLTLGGGVMVGAPLANDPGPGNIIANTYFVDNTFALFKTGTDPVVQFDSGYQFQLSRGTNHDFLYYGASALNFWSRQSDGVFINARSFVQGNGAYLNSSDRRLKEDIQPTAHGLETILKLEPVEFRRKPAPIADSVELERPLEIGFIANDVAAILPEAIRVTGMDQAVYEASDSDPFLGLTSETITAVLVNAVKELSAQVSELQSRLPA